MAGGRGSRSLQEITRTERIQAELRGLSGKQASRPVYSSRRVVCIRFKIGRRDFLCVIGVCLYVCVCGWNVFVTQRREGGLEASEKNRQPQCACCTEQD